jgi:GNAT superfamily N-acetyltransferase
MAVATLPIGSITNVVVEESFRRRGFGRAITAAAAMACASGGSEGVALGASRMGYPLYLSMGFEHRYDLAALTPRPPLPTPREMGSEPSRSAPLPEVEGS